MSRSRKTKIKELFHIRVKRHDNYMRCVTLNQEKYFCKGWYWSNWQNVNMDWRLDITFGAMLNFLNLIIAMWLCKRMFLFLGNTPWSSTLGWKVMISATYIVQVRKKSAILNATEWIYHNLPMFSVVNIFQLNESLINNVAIDIFTNTIFRLLLPFSG